MTSKKITSAQNSLVKTIVQLQEKSRNRKQSGLFVIEGLREIELAIQGDYIINTVLFYSDIIPETNIPVYLTQNQKIELIEISKEIYHKLAYRETTEGVIAIAKTKSHALSSLHLSENPLILVAEATEKPGNIGAILRTADAAKIDAVIIANPKSDIYNPNVIRSSIGCLFTNQIAVASTEEAIDYLKNKNINIYCATLQDSTSYHTLDYNKPCAFVVGTEDTGLTQAWRDASTKNIIIPMSGSIDSMNVSVAASILVFEAKRQRNFL